MASLTLLSSELLELIVFQLEEVEDVISLGSSSRRLREILSTARAWRIVLANTEMVEEGRVLEARVRRLTAFLVSLPSSSCLLGLLHQTICSRYPASSHGLREEESLTVSCPGQLHLQVVSGLRLQLLVLAGGREELHRVVVGGIRVRGGISRSLQLCLASMRGIRELEVTGGVSCTSEEEGRSLASLLEQCSRWRVQSLGLEGRVGGGTWEGLGRAAARGRLQGVRTGREVVGRGRGEELRAVWGSTEGGWLVEEGEEQVVIDRVDGVVEGWRRIRQIVQEFVGMNK